MSPKLPSAPKDADLVYSSTGGRQKNTQKAKKSASTSLPAPGPCKMRLESKGRGGKQVTVLFNLPWTLEEATALMRKLQEALACGATLKDGTIELRGDLRARVEAYCQKAQITVVRAGG